MILFSELMLRHEEFLRGKFLRKKTLRSPIRVKEENTLIDPNEAVSNEGVTCNCLGIVSSGGPGISSVEPSACAARELDRTEMGCREKRWVELALDRVQ